MSIESEQAEIRVKEIMVATRRVEKPKKHHGKGWYGCKERHQLARILYCIRQKGKDE